MFGVLTFAFSASNGQTAATPFMLGRSLDITKLDLWTMSYPPGLEADLFRAYCDIRRAGCCRYVEEYGYGGKITLSNGNTDYDWNSTPYEEQRWFWDNKCVDEIGESHDPSGVHFANCPYTCPDIDVVRANCCATGDETSYNNVNCDQILNGDYSSKCSDYTYSVGNLNRWDMPDTCWSKQSTCSGSSEADTRHFVNTEQAEDYVKSTAGVNSEISAYGVDFTLNTIFNEKHLFGTSQSIAGVFGHDIQTNNCYSMLPTCWTSGGYLATGILEQLKTLPKDPLGQDTAILDRWVTNVIDIAGTHLVIGTTNGAAVKYVVYSDNTSRTAVNCADQKICSTFTVKIPSKDDQGNDQGSTPVDVDGDNSKTCNNDNKQCSSTNSTSFTFESNCKALGGTASTRAAVCTSTGDGYKIDATALRTHLAAGDTSEASVIELTLIRLDTVVKKMGLEAEVIKASPSDAPHDIVATLEMAIDYYLCKSRNEIFTSQTVWKWNSPATPSCPNGNWAVATAGCPGTGICCTAHWRSDCGQSCAQSACTSAEGSWIAKDYSKNPYTCEIPTGRRGYCENTCDRVCVHGSLDEHTCTCKCLSNANGGWTGENCETEYGDVQYGTLELADGTQLFVDSDGWVQAMPEGSGENTDASRREWAYFYPTLRLRNGMTLYNDDGFAAASHGNAAHVYYEASSKTWQMNEDGKIKQLYVTSGIRWGWGAFAESGSDNLRDTNTDPFRRTWQWGKSMLMCAPGCPSAWIGNAHCETNEAKTQNVCDVAACNYDCGDCGKTEGHPTCPSPPLLFGAQMHPAVQFNMSAADTAAADTAEPTQEPTADPTRSPTVERSNLEEAFSFEMSFRNIGGLMDRLGQFLTHEGFRR